MTAAADDEHRPPRRKLTVCVSPRASRLDDVDLGGEVARHFEANFLLTNFGLRPGLHVVSSNFKKAAVSDPNPDSSWSGIDPGADTFSVCRPTLRIDLEKSRSIRLEIFRSRKGPAGQLKALHVYVCKYVRSLCNFVSLHFARSTGGRLHAKPARPMRHRMIR